MLRSFVHHVGLCCMMLAYVASSLKPVKLFAQHMPTFLLFSGDRWARWLHSNMKRLYSVIKSIVFVLTSRPRCLSSLFIVYVTGSIFKMEENKCQSDAFSRFPSSAFIECHIAVSQRILGKYQTQTPQGITVKATLPNML